jgi:hypothetical protein
LLSELYLALIKTVEILKIENPAGAHTQNGRPAFAINQ